MDKNVRSYFNHHPDVETFYFTADGYAFFTENDAYNHARNLVDDEIKTISRLDCEEEVFDELDELDAE